MVFVILTSDGDIHGVITSQSPTCVQEKHHSTPTVKTKNRKLADRMTLFESQIGILPTG